MLHKETALSFSACTSCYRFACECDAAATKQNLLTNVTLKLTVMQQRACYDYSWVVSLPCLSAFWNGASPYFCQHNWNMRVPHAKRFTTFLPIIAIPAFCAQGFLRPFEKEDPFCYRKDWDEGGKRAREREWRGLERKGRERVMWAMALGNVQASLHANCTCTYLLLHLCKYGLVYLFIWAIVCLPESKPECHSCSKRTPTGSRIREKLLA